MKKVLGLIGIGCLLVAFSMCQKAAANPITLALGGPPPTHTVTIQSVSDWNDWQLNVDATYTGTNPNDKDLTSIHFRRLPGDVTDPWEYEDFTNPITWSSTTTAPGMISFSTTGVGLGPIKPGPLHVHFDTDYSWADMVASGTQVQFDYSDGSLTSWYTIPEPATIGLLALGGLAFVGRRLWSYVPCS